MKQIKILLAAFLTLSILGACAPSQSVQVESSLPGDRIRVIPQAEIVYQTFEETVADCTDIIRGRFVTEHEYDEYSELEFTVLEVCKGQTQSDSIFVMNCPKQATIEGTGYSYLTDSNVYEEGQDYLLVLDRTSSVYYEHDRYTQPGDIYIPLTTSESCTMYGQDLSVHSEIDMSSVSADIYTEVENVIASIPSTASETGLVGSTEFIDTDSISETADFAGYIFRVQVGELYVSGKYNGTETFRCSIEEIYRGNLTGEEKSAGILVPFFSGTAQEGDEFLLLLTRAGETSKVYTFSSRVAAIRVEDTAAVETVLEQIAE